MLIVALLLLPTMALLLLGMDRIEDRMDGVSRTGSGHHRLRHLRLVHGDEQSSRETKSTRQAGREAA
ncbi:hypothetical protein [Streptomyces endophyticus]|uniref:Secreted protein n=1 Tax=Streptomyces endophyticus TaxID=714166 RepID=A0ABU6FH24_9ACTN|nr:hypothetical protein [Streptomyces endophyticus]MEB8342932.1 hypothetical protein [Streptomyces endophyticus]